MALNVVGAVLGLLYGTLASGILVPVVSGRKAEPAAALAWLGVLLYNAAAWATLAEAVTKGPLTIYSGLVVHDPFTSFLAASAGLAAVIALLSIGTSAAEWPSHPALYSLLPIILFGTYLMAGAYNAVMVLAVWLLVSVASYVVIALPGDAASRGAAVRYILTGAVATLFLAFWVAVHAIAVGSTPRSLGLADPFDFSGYPSGGLTAVALTLFLAAVGFKLGVVPFHWWLPNVYARADGRAVSVVAGIAKLGFVAVAGRLVYSAATPQNAAGLAAILAGLAVVTMTYGNVAALTSRDLQGILAYSSIAQIGYILTALAAAAYLRGVAGDAASLAALAAVAIHGLAYALSKAPLFAALGGEGGGEARRLRGLLRSDPASAIGIAVLLFSLLGVPPLLGFWGKLYMFMSAVKYSIPLTLIALLNSGVSAVYYVAAVRELASPAPEAPRLARSASAAIVSAALIALAIGLLAPSLYPLLYP
ncbi:MAG: NADH-quinone oxidoreductase subunit N [Desulfurococcales archaeon]|nr:NADH-quinone oxidoreductase subunit N [Desulfurococcales archaeon]